MLNITFFQVTKKRIKEELSLAQTLTAGVLEQAALMRNDESILVHIREQECVAIEARYHRRCHKAYTRCVSLKPKIVGQTYDKAFDQFCLEVVEKRILHGEILLLGYLLKEFISCVKTIENVDVSYTAERLKKRIQDRYPQLVFHRSKKMNRGILVYADNITVGDVADEMLAIGNEPESESEDESDQRITNDKTVSPIKICILPL